MKRNDHTETLVDRFVRDVAICLNSREPGQVNAYNAASNRLARTHEALLATGRGQEALRQLSSHESAAVRAEAAISLLDFSNEEALPLLADLLAWSLDERDARGVRPPEASFVLRRVKDTYCFRLGMPMLDIPTIVLGRPPTI